MESTTPATCGLTSPRQFAEYDPDTSSWRTWPAIGLWGSTSYSGAWPRSGMTCGGRAYELRTSAHPTAGNESSSLLPTPVTEPATGNGHARNLGRETQLLPTPRTSDTNGAGSHGTGGPDLRTVVDLLPTPTARDHKGANQRQDDTCLHGALLPTPTATPYGNNQSPSPGAAVRPSLDSLFAGPLLPTPQATDGTGGPKRLRADGRTETDHGANLRDLFSGASTNPRFDGGNDSPG